MSDRAKKKARTIKTDYLARVEGEAALYVKLRNGEVADCKLRIFEPPRFFEAFLRGRGFTEVPDIAARICGICPIAYQMSAVHALESICGIVVDGPLRELRRLVYCGEWIESHVLHVAMLHAPDFLGYSDAVAMAKDAPETVAMALSLKKAGNEIVAFLGGREIHPINVRVGGFYKVPRKSEIGKLRDRVERARDEAIRLARWVSGFEFPDFKREYEFVALSHPEEYPFNEGRLRSNRGLDIEVAGFDWHFQEEHVLHSTALRSTRKDTGAYLCGPLARYNLNFDKLTSGAKETALEIGVRPPVSNPFKSILVRAIEVVFACEEALRIIDTYEEPDRPFVPCEPRSGAGSGCTEAPRGLCYHRYRIDREGTILDAKIVPPTSQNQRSIEEDLREFVRSRLDLDQERLTWQCEQVIRNYDPCISCSVHFLRLRLDRD